MRLHLWTGYGLVEETGIHQMNIKLQLQSTEFTGAFGSIDDLVTKGNKDFLRSSHLERDKSGYLQLLSRGKGEAGTLQQGKPHIPNSQEGGRKPHLANWKEASGENTKAQAEEPGGRRGWKKQKGPIMHCSLVDHVLEPNLPLKAVGAAARVTRSDLWFEAVTPAAMQGTAWKEAGVKMGRSLGGSCNSQLRSDKSLFTSDPQCLAWCSHRVSSL